MRKLVVLILLTLMLSVFAPVMAQETPVFCGDLAAEDCTILEQSAAAQTGLSSAAADIDIQIDVENIPNTPTINITLNGTAAYEANMAAFEALASAEALEGEEALSALVTALGGFDGELDLTLTLPQDIATGFGLPANEVNLQLALVSGVGYINFDTLDSLVGGMLSAQGLTGWGGLNFIDLINEAVAQDPTVLEQFNLGASAAALDPNTLALAEGLEQYITIERGADVDGAAAFTTTFDFGGAVNDPAFQELLQTIIESSGQAMSDQEFQQTIGVLQLVGDDVTLVSTQYIDTTTGFVQGAELNFSLDLTTLLAASGQTVDGDSIISFVATIDYSGQNETVVEAPAGATIATMEDLQALGMQ
jgi:hypothetical protein